MPAMKVFFDYACPYCLKGHEYLEALAPAHPEVAIEWWPCEAHPRPEPGPHTDLCVQVMHFARDAGADLWALHRRLYKACLQDRIDYEDIDTLAATVADLVDAPALKAALARGDYAEAAPRANDHAYEESGVWAVPAYRLGARRLDAVEGVGVEKAQLEAFMAAGD